MTAALVQVADAWKKYPKNHAAARRHARRLMWRQLMGRSDVRLADGEFWALSGFDLEIVRGEAVGVIGLNGSGKSTALNLIAGYIQADRGQCVVQGKVSAFINLSSGLHQNLSGRENIFLKGALDGRRRAEMGQSLDSIIDFAGLDDFIDTPVGRYSTGMRMRLAFSIAVHTDPDILLVDEVMSVGDFEFRQKCLQRMQSLRQQSAVVLVSHSMNDISRFCDRAVVLDGGQVAFAGDVGEAIQRYRNAEAEVNKGGVSLSHVEREFENSDALEVRCVDFSPLKNSVGRFDGFEIQADLRALREIRSLVVGIPVKSHDGRIVTAVSSEGQGEPISLEAGQTVDVRIKVDALGLNPGRYNVVIGIVDGPEFLYRKVLHTVGVRDDGHPHWGSFTPQSQWYIRTSTS